MGIKDTSYVVAVKTGKNGTEYVSFGHRFNMTKRAAGQVMRGLAKIDNRYKDARVIMGKTARKAGILA